MNIATIAIISIVSLIIISIIIASVYKNFISKEKIYIEDPEEETNVIMDTRYKRLHKKNIYVDNN